MASLKHPPTLKRTRSVAPSAGAGGYGSSQLIKSQRRTSLYKNLPLGGMPKTKVVRLKYVEFFSSSSAGSGPVVKYFSANGCYDPYITGIGHQPRGYDQWTAFYDHYCVLSSKIRVQAVTTDDGTSTDAGACFGLILDDDTSFGHSSVAEVIESGQSRGWRYCSHNPSASSMTGNKPTIISKASMPKFFGVAPKAYQGDSRFTPTIGANPTDQAYWAVWYGAPDGAAASSMTFMAEIEYIVRFSEPKRLAQS